MRMRVQCFWTLGMLLQDMRLIMTSIAFAHYLLPRSAPIFIGMKSLDGFTFPTTFIGGCNRSFLAHWLKEHAWLCYSIKLGGAFCTPCALFNGVHGVTVTEKLSDVSVSYVAEVTMVQSAWVLCVSPWVNGSCWWVETQDWTSWRGYYSCSRQGKGRQHYQKSKHLEVNYSSCSVLWTSNALPYVVMQRSWTRQVILGISLLFSSWWLFMIFICVPT